MTRKVVKTVPPDGGWGWFIVLGASLINLSTRAIEPSFGLLFGDLLTKLGVATTGASIVIATLDGIINFSGLFVGPLIKRLSYRKVALLGGILSSSALFLTSFANSMVHIIATFSVMGGLGFGLATSSTLVGINSYFSKRKAQAVGLSMAGTAVGFMIMPQIVSILLSEFDFRSAMLILSALSLHAIAGSLLFHPVKWHLKTVIPDDEKIPGTIEEAEAKLLAENRTTSMNTPSPKVLNRLPRKFSGTALNTQHSHLLENSHPSAPILSRRKGSILSNVSLVDLTGSTTHIDFGNNIQEEDEDDTGLEITINSKEPEKKLEDEKPPKNEKEEKEPGCWDKFRILFDLHLLKDPVYLNIVYGLSVNIVAEMNFKLIIPFFFGNLGYNKREIAMYLSLMAIADISARVIIPPILDRITLSKRVSLMIGSTLVAVCRSILAEQTETVPLLTIMIIHGFFRGATLINNPLVLSEYSTGDNFPAVLGLSMVARGIAIVILGPICGFLRDYTQSFSLYIHFQSIMILSMVIAWSVELISRRRSKPKLQTIVPPSNN